MSNLSEIKPKHESAWARVHDGTVAPVDAYL